MELCVQAKLVTASFLQGQDETNYAVWKKTENADCDRAGLPR